MRTSQVRPRGWSRASLKKRNAAYQAACEFNKRHGLTPRRLEGKELFLRMHKGVFGLQRAVSVASTAKQELK